MGHAATMERIYELISAHDIEGFSGLLAEGFVEHEELPGGGPPTREGVERFFRDQIAAFPDFAMTLLQVVDGGDTVAARVRATGTQQGEFMGLPATGRAIDVEAIDIMRFGDDGLVHEHWGVFDGLRMMEQLGAIPS
jgi:steroid delta-isomerase-like uncharacterized protein